MPIAKKKWIYFSKGKMAHLSWTPGMPRAGLTRGYLTFSFSPFQMMTSTNGSFGPAGKPGK